MSRDALEEAATLCERPQKEVPKPAPSSVPREPDLTIVRPLARPTCVGDVIAEKYRLVRTLGRGGMGRIFAADHLLLGTTVALKFMHPHLAKDRGQVARFSREARAAATLKSANAARIIDVDQLPTGELYIVMEYLEGASLETMAVDGRGLPIADAVLYVIQACDALAEAHSRSIIHRDVKPANLFLTKGKSGEPVIKVLDFGLAKSMAATEGLSTSSASTIGGQALGTPYYMSPEQITGKSAIDGRSDVWALGATLYELLTGHLAFPGSNAAVVFDHILKRAPTPLRTHRPDVPESLVAIIDRCLQQEVTARFQTVRELTKALEGSLGRQGSSPFFMPDTAPLMAAPLNPDRFVRSSAPPGPLAPVLPAQSLAANPLSAQPLPAQPLPPPVFAQQSVPPPPFAPQSLPPPPFAPQSLPPPPFPPMLEPSVRASAASFSNVGPPPSSEVPEVPTGPSMRQTVLAALAGPALIAIAAGVVAIVMGTSLSANTGSARTGVPNKAIYVTAKSGDSTRLKQPAVPVPEKPERPRK